MAAGFKIGSQSVNAAYVGSSAVSKIYLGDSLVYGGVQWDDGTSVQWDDGTIVQEG